MHVDEIDCDFIDFIAQKSVLRDFQFAKEKYRGDKRDRNKIIILASLGLMVGTAGFHFVHLT